MKRFLAGLTILSVTFTQAAPAWALRPSGAQNPAVQAGLEDTLTKDSSENAVISRAKPITVPPGLLRFLRSRVSRPLAQRLNALSGYGAANGYGKEILKTFAESGIPLQRRVSAMDDFLFLALEDGAIEGEEVDPELALALLTGSDGQMVARGRAAFGALGRICPTCGDHLYHEQGAGQAGLSFEEHDRLHVRTAIATAVEFLASPSGKLPVVQRVTAGHHKEEPARSLGVLSVMMSAFYKNDEGSDAPGISPVRLHNDAQVLGRLYTLTSQAGPVVLLLRHRRSEGDEADHWVSVRSINIGEQTVTLFTNGEEETRSYDQFLEDYLPAGDLYGLLTPDQTALWSDTGRVFAATPKELTSVYGCCGIIITLGRRSGAGQFAAMQNLAYRGQDNAGFSRLGLHGVETVKEMGSPTNLIRAIEIDGQGFPEEGMAWFLETFPAALQDDARIRTALEKLRQGRVLNNQEKRVIHRLWMGLTDQQRAAIAKTSEGNAREILDSHNYTLVYPRPPGEEGLPSDAELPLKTDDLYRQLFYTEQSQAVVSPLPDRIKKERGEVDQWNSVGRGNHGSVWSGRSFSVPDPKDGSHEAHIETLKEFRRRVNELYDYDLSYIRDRLRFHLAGRLGDAAAQEKLTQSEAATAMREFLRLFETVAEGRDIEKEDAAVWRGLWAFLSGTTVWFAGHIAADPVRHVFRLQSSLIGVLRQHPNWREKVETRFAGLLRQDRVYEKRDWFQDWLVENFSNTPSKAFEALTAWFQEEFIDGGVRRRMGIELGRLDSVTLGYMEIVDKVVGHDRWATVGSKEPKDAQPHTDTGLLAGIPPEVMKRLVGEAEKRTEKTSSMTLSPEAPRQEREQVQKLLSQHFLKLVTQHLAEHPEHRGQPQRSTPHNGDLDSGVQTGIRPLIKDLGGYVAVRQVVNEKPDGSWETVSENILTDTWGLLGLHEYIHDAFKKDTLLGLTNGYTYLPEQKNRVGFMPDAYRIKWNEIMDHLERAHGAVPQLRALSVREREMQIAEEISHRIANIEFAHGILIKPGEAGSEIGAGLMTAVEPRLQVFVSHNRPIYLMVVRQPDGQLNWQVSSDYRTSLSLFDRRAVEKGVSESNELFQWKELALKELDGKPLSKAEHEQKEKAEIRLWSYKQRTNSEAEIFKEAEKKQREINSRFPLTLMATFKGEDKYIHVNKKFDSETKQWDLIIEVSTLEGETITRYEDGKFRPPRPEREERNIKVETKNKYVEVDIASRFGFPSFGEKEMYQIPLALRETRFWYGLQNDGTLDMSREGVSKRFGEPVDYGLNREKIREWFRNGGDTILITGVGSSENDALAAEAFFKHLLPGVKVIIKDPSTLLNTGADYVPGKTMVVGLSWSGVTALTLSILDSLRERGLLCCAITGNPDKDIGVATRDSGGVVKAHTRQEVAVYTTVGFSTILYDLILMAGYLNILKEGTETEQGKKEELQRRRREVAPSLYSVPEVIADLRDRPELSLKRQDSYLYQVGGRLAPFNGAGFVGPDPSLPEIALKIGEVRNSGHTMYDYSDDDPWHLIWEGMPGDRRKGWFVDATTLAKLPRALAWVREANRRGQHVVVQTFDEKITFTPDETNAGHPKKWEAFKEQMKQGPLLDIFRVPKLHPLVQPIVNVQIGAPLATTTAHAAGFSSEARDAPRNLAKAVTVQSQARLIRAMRIQDFVRAYPAAGMEERIVSMGNYMDGLGQRWAGMDTAARAIHRLPQRMLEIISGFSKPNAFLLDQAIMVKRFGEGLKKLKRVVILTSEDRNAVIAARMAQELYEFRESVTTNSEKDKIFEKIRDQEGKGYDPNKVERLINGDLFEFRFVRSPRNDPKENKIVISRMEEGKDGKRHPIGKGERGELALFGDETSKNLFSIPRSMPNLRRETEAGTQYLVNGQWYTITADKGRGINLTAAEPELLGADVEVVNIEDVSDLSRVDVNPEDTLVVVLSRSLQRKGESESVIAPISSSGAGRRIRELEAMLNDPAAKPETEFSDAVKAMKNLHPDLAVFFAGSKNSFLRGQQSVGVALLPEDLDAVSATPAFFLALLRVGIELGSLKGISQSEIYRESMDAIPTLAASTMVSIYQERADVGEEVFDPAVSGVQFAIGHRPVEVRYNRRGKSLQFFDGGRLVGALPVRVSEFKKVLGFQNDKNAITVGDRIYDVKYVPDFGVVIHSRLPDYQGGGSLRDALVSLTQNKFNHPYTNWFAVGGGADFAGAGLYKKMMATLGKVQAHALVVDAFVHGPLAEVDDRILKWADPVRRRGINPDYDPNSVSDLTQKDAAAILFGADMRGAAAASIDGQRVATRSGILFNVVTPAARDRSEVLKQGAFHIITVPQAPNLLSVITHMILAPAFSYELGQSIQQEQYRYREDSPWAALARLPKVIPTEGPLAPEWQIALEDQVMGPDDKRPDVAKWMVEVYRRFREDPTKPEISTFTSPAHSGRTSFIMVIPFEHEEDTPAPIGEIHEKIKRFLSLRQKPLGYYDDRYYWSGFQEEEGAPQVGLLHIAFKSNEVTEEQGKEAILEAVERFIPSGKEKKAGVPPFNVAGWLDAVHIVLDVGSVKEITDLLGSFGVDSAPRIIVRNHPTGEEGRYLAVAVDQRSNGRTKEVVQEAIGSLGGSVAVSHTAVADGAVVMLADFKLEMPALVPEVTNKIKRGLLGSRVPPKFKEIFSTSRAQHYLYGAYRAIQTVPQPIVALSGNGAEGEKNISAMAVILPDDEQVEPLKARIADIMVQNGLTPELSEQAYQEDPNDLPVRYLRFSVNVPYSHETILSAYDAVEQFLISKIGFPVAQPERISPAAPLRMPGTLLDTIRGLAETAKSKLDGARTVVVEHKYDPASEQTAFVIMGPSKPGLFGLIYDPVRSARIDVKYMANFQAEWNYAYLTVAETPEELEKRGILKGIDGGIARYETWLAIRKAAPASMDDDTVEELGDTLRTMIDMGRPFSVFVFGSAPDETDIRIIVSAEEGRFAGLRERLDGILGQAPSSDLTVQLPSGQPPARFIRYMVSKPEESAEVSAAQAEIMATLEAMAQAGAEEAFELEGATAVAKKQAVIQNKALRLPNGAWLDAATGGTIEIAAGARIGPGAVLNTVESGGRITVGAAHIHAGTVVEHTVTLRDRVNARGYLYGTAKLPVLLGEGTQITSPNAEIRPGAILLPLKDEKGNLLPVKVDQAIVEGLNVIWGDTDVGPSAYVRPYNVVAGHVFLGEKASLARGFIEGVSGKTENRSELAHKVTAGRGIFIPLQPDPSIEPFSEKFFDWLRKSLAAFRFGKVSRDSKVWRVTTEGPAIHAKETVYRRYQGVDYDLSARGINGGHSFVISDFSSMGEGWKSYAVIMGGAHFGVEAGVKVPAYVGPDAIIQSRAEATLMEAAPKQDGVWPPGSFVLPLGVDKEENKVKPGFFTGDRTARIGKKGAETVRVHLGAIETIVVLAEISAEGYALTSDEDTRLGLRKEVEILSGNAREGMSFTAKLKEMAGLSPQEYADQSARLQARLTAALGQVGFSAAGLEEIQDVLERFGPPLRSWYDQDMPLVFLSDATDNFGINSALPLSADAAQRLAAAGVTAKELELLLNDPSMPSLSPAVIDLQIAAQRLRMGMAPAQTLLHARRRLQGTDGWRGRKMPVGKVQQFLGGGELSPDIVEAYHYAYVRWLIHTGLMKPGEEYVLGYDPRDDAEMEGIPQGAFVDAAIRGAQQAGARVVNAGLVPIWAAPLYMIWRGAKATGHITASHNLKGDTGNKLFGPGGLKLFPEDEYRLSPFFYRAYAQLKTAAGMPSYRVADPLVSTHEEAMRVAYEALLQPENSWALRADGTPIEEPLKGMIVVTDAARGTYAGRAKDPERPNPTDPGEFGPASRILGELGATVYMEIGKNLGKGNVNEDSGAGLFEDKGSGLARVTRDDIRPGGALAGHEMFPAMFKAADDHPEVKTGQRRLAGFMSDADGDRLILLIYDPTQDAVVVLTGDETAFIQGTYLLQKSPWQQVFRGAVFASTVESDFFAAQAAHRLGFTERYTGVGDKWILLQAAVAWMKAIVSELEREGVPGTELDALARKIDQLSGEEMRAAEVAEVMGRLEALAQRNGISPDALSKALSTPGRIPYAVASEESGHNITALYLTDSSGRRVPVFAGNALKSGINTLVALQQLFPTPQETLVTVDGRRVNLFEYVREPFPRGHKRSMYAYYVDKPRLVAGTPAWKAIQGVMEQAVPRIFGKEFQVRLLVLPEEPGLLYLTILGPDGKPAGAVFARNSGTENKTSIYVRGRREDAGKLDRLAAMVEAAGNMVVGDERSPWHQAKELVLARIQTEGVQPVDILRSEVARNVPALASDAQLERLFKELAQKAKVVSILDGTVSLTPRPLEPGDAEWVRQQIAAGAEERPVSDALREIEDFVAAAQGVEVSFSGGVSRTGQSIGPRVLSGGQLTRPNIQDLINAAERASQVPGQVKLQYWGANNNKIEVSPAGAEEAAPIRTVSALKAELTLVPGVAIPSDVQTGHLAFIVTPDGLPKFATAVMMFGAQGVMADVLAVNARHMEKVSRQLEQMGLTNVVVHDLEKDFSGNLTLALKTLREVHAEARRRVEVVTAQTGLLAVARFLRTPVPESFIRALELIAARSNDLWS